MKIIIADHYGVCFGVRDAIQKAESLAQESPLTILGELVHNPIVRKQLQKIGVSETSLDSASSATPNVMITAHGASDAKHQQWREAGFEVVDGTCPLVRHAHGRLRMLVEAGYFPVVIGKADHVEVRGLTGDFPEARVVENESDIAQLPPQPRYGVISQTTQPIARVQKLVDAIREKFANSEVRFIDTVCKPTKDRQRALQSLIAQVEVVVVVGGHGSNNTRQLVLTAEAAGRRAYHIEHAGELRAEWFESVESVGVTAGTSTLRETVESVRVRIEEIAASRVRH